MGIIPRAAVRPLQAVEIDPELLTDGAAGLAEPLRNAAHPEACLEDTTPESWAYTLAHVAALPQLSATAADALVTAAERLEALQAARQALDAAALALACALEAEPA